MVEAFNNSRNTLPIAGKRRRAARAEQCTACDYREHDLSGHVGRTAFGECALKHRS